MNSGFFAPEERHGYGQLAVSLVASALALTLCSCVSTTPIRAIGTTLNERFTLDRQPLTASQQAENPQLGPFRRDPGSVSSYAYPLVEHSDSLLQADCFWVANDAGVGDDILLNWEGVLHLDPALDGDKHLKPENNQFSMCRFNHPTTRQWAEFSEGEYNPEDDEVYGGPSAIGGSGVIPVSGIEQVQPEEDSVAIFSPHISMKSHPTPDWRNACLSAEPASLETDVTTGFQGFDGLSDPQGYVSGCSADGRRVRPENDANWVVEMRSGAKSPPFTSLPLVGIKAAATGETLARQASISANGRVFWQTTELGSTTNPSAGRWRENFSSSIRVSQVRLLRRVNGQSEYLRPDDLLEASVCVRPSSQEPACRWLCPVSSGPQGEAVADLSNDGCLTGDRELLVPDLTPTVDVAALDANQGLVVRPLVWETRVADPQDVFFEFTLLNHFSPISLRTDALVMFGEVPAGTEPTRFVTVRNTGYRPLRIENVTKGLDSENPDEFALQVFGQRHPVPLGVVQDAVPDNHGSLGLMSLLEDFAAYPFPEIDLRENHVLFSWPHPQEQSLSIEGVPLTYQHGVLQGHDLAEAFEFRRDGLRQPFAVAARTPRTTPFTLAPGDAFEIAVSLQPIAPGDKFLSIGMTYVDPGAPGTSHYLSTSVGAEVLAGPIPGTFPASVFLNDNPGGAQQARFFTIFNHGDQDLTLQSLWLAGDNEDFFQLGGLSLPMTIPPGGLALESVEYLTECVAAGSLAEHVAVVIIETSDRDLALPLRGISRNC